MSAINVGAGAMVRHPPAWPNDVGGRPAMGTVRIPLSQGKVALIDAVDEGAVSRHRWYAVRHEERWYAKTRIDGRETYLHRLILGFPPERIDHKNGDGLDCRRLNLRACTNAENMRNRRGPQANNTSGYLGVSWNPEKRRWRARLGSTHVGYYVLAEDAARARDAKATELWGEFAALNFPGAQEEAT